MSEFDQPDCAFPTPRGAETTTPLQALTLLNHRFSLDMAAALAARLDDEAGADPAAQVDRAFRLAFSRLPAPTEREASIALIAGHGLRAFCRVLLNTNELLYLQ
jgi:hypothetical protein